MIIPHLALASTLNLDGNANTGGDAAGDLVSGVEHVIGSDHDDSITGAAVSTIEHFEGGAGDDTFEGRGGADINDGGADFDTVSYVLVFSSCHGNT